MALSTRLIRCLGLTKASQCSSNKTTSSLSPRKIGYHAVGDWRRTVQARVRLCVDCGARQRMVDGARTFCTNASYDEDEVNQATDNSDLRELLDGEMSRMSCVSADEYLLPSEGHRVMVIQPDFKFDRQRLTTAELRLSEACALVYSLPKWSVVDKGIYSVKHVHKKEIFGSGTLSELTRRVRASQQTTAVFLGTNMLTGLQLASLQALWRVPVYDRYTLVLQIFKTRARTAEAKLQVALAELPYYRSRLVGMHRGTLDQQQGGLATVGGSGEKILELRQRLLQEKGIKIKKALSGLRVQREILRRDRKKKEIPTVAVVGYTNAGKTSLIKALTGEEDMMPRDQLFATLDVTAHAGVLPGNVRVLYIDTVGFISDIPVQLIESFSATLEDITTADVVLHVRDVSHPDCHAQKVNVLHTLSQLHLPPALLNSMIEVLNKADLVTREQLDEINDSPDSTVVTSVTRGQGLFELRSAVEDVVIESTGRLRKRLKIPQRGELLSWLYREGDIRHVADCPTSTEHLMIDVVMTTAAYSKFCSLFRRKS